MKKSLLILIAFILAMSNSFTIQAIQDDDYTSLADNSGYTRIEKINGVWYGVINITSTKLEWINDSRGRGNRLYVDFDRDTQELVYVNLKGIAIPYCTGIEWMSKCWTGEIITDREISVEIYNNYESDTLRDFFGMDTIITIDSNDPYYGIYDYMIHVRTDVIYTGVDLQLKSVTILEYTYILTEQEIIDLRLDLQEQYEEEREIIVSNPITTNEEKDIQLADLHDEYVEFEIDFDEEITSICIGEHCTAINTESEDDLVEGDEWLSLLEGKIQDWILKTAIIITGMFLSGTLIYITVYIFINKVINATGTIAFGGLKSIGRSGTFWGDNIWRGFTTVLSNIGKGISAIFSRK